MNDNVQQLNDFNQDIMIIVSISWPGDIVIAPPRRKTQQRDLILHELRRLTSHPTAAELYEIVRRRLPHISLGTVYRNLHQLAEIGQIRKLEAGSGSTRFDGNMLPHYHVRCQQCGRVDDLPFVPADVVRDDVGALCGYQILRCHLEFIGLCPGCRPQPGDGGTMDRLSRPADVAGRRTH